MLADLIINKLKEIIKFQIKTDDVYKIKTEKFTILLNNLYLLFFKTYASRMYHKRC